MCGRDGALIASDTREYRAPGEEEHGHGVAVNMVTKIRIDPTGQYAWAYAGGEITPVAADYLAQAFQGGRSFSDSELDSELRSCGDRAWNNFASGPNPHSTIALLHGPSRRIVRAKLSAGIVSKERITRHAAQVATHFRIEIAQVSTPQEFVLKYKNRWNLGLADTSEGILTDDFRFRMNP